MSDQTEKCPPAGNPRGEEITGRRSTPCHSTGSDALHAALALERGDHALLVTRRIRNGGIRRRVMLSLGAAERAVALAEEAGQPATITLIRLQPVGLVDLDEFGGAR